MVKKITQQNYKEPTLVLGYIYESDKKKKFIFQFFFGQAFYAILAGSFLLNLLKRDSSGVNNTSSDHKLIVVKKNTSGLHFRVSRKIII